jgi:DNA-binding response OmpR family regulator
MDPNVKSIDDSKPYDRRPSCEVRSCNNGTAGYEEALRKDGDLILLDLMVPGKNGFNVCRDLRQAGLTTPILMLSARAHLIDKVLGLKLGADDCVVKPFEMLELITRIEVLLRRRSKDAPHDGAYQFGSVTLTFPEPPSSAMGSTSRYRHGNLSCCES